MKPRRNSPSNSHHVGNLSTWRSSCAAILLSLFIHPASAHHGFDAHASVRLLDKQSIVIVRMTPSVASVLMGSDAPAGWTGDVSDESRLKLQALGKRLFVITTPEGPLEPSEIRVSREVNADIAFVLTYPRVNTWPFTIEAGFCKDFGPELTGSIRVFGPPEQPTDRQGKQLALLELTRRERTLSLPAPSRTP